MGMESKPLAASGSVFSREPIVGGRRCGEASSTLGDWHVQPIIAFAFAGLLDLVLVCT